MADDPALPQAFLSYAHADDEFLDGGITWLRRELQRGMRALTGEPFEIFQDKDGIAFGEHWPDRIEDALVGARFLIPVLTPSYFSSLQCRAEAAAFLELEKQVGRQDLILPIYLIKADVLEEMDQRSSNTIAEVFYKRQYADWRDAAFDLRNSPRIKERAFNLAIQMKAASERFAKDAPPIIPEQGLGIRFELNKDGRIDRARDEPSEVTDNDPRLRSLQEGLQKAADDFLNSFHGEAGQNVFGPLIDNVRAYREAISGLLSEIQLTDVYRYGLELQNWVLANKRDVDRLDPLPDLEDHQQAALSNLLGLHGPFILSTNEGEMLQAKADQDQMAAEERMRVWSPELSDAAEVSDHATERTKAILKDINQPSKDGVNANRRALLALSTNRNFLSASAEAATGKIFAGISKNAAAEASRSAGGFLLRNEELIDELNASSSYSLGWLGHLIEWLKTPTAREAPPVTTIIANMPRAPGTVFRDIDEPWCPEMVVIPAGEFLMGSPEDEEGRGDNEGPQHLVTIRRPFALGRYPVTLDEYGYFCEAIGRDQPGDERWGRGRRPVINVSWQDAKDYCDWLSEQTDRRYRLPSEAEWEYACRAGSTMAYAFGNGIDETKANLGWQVGKTTEVGTYPANAFKLSDMHGNVWEWCEDRYRENYKGAPDDGTPWLSDQGHRVVRGGSWDSEAGLMRSACRDAFVSGLRFSNLGFRCAGVQGS
ncbi:MAG: SUMF1/EgtB/PvdO family nonheme iron enzyme [Pseudomonadota bacterium]